VRVERTVRIFDSHIAAELADQRAAAMAPQARLDLLLQMIRRYREGAVNLQPI
jgi:hypothetical protein